MSAANLRVAMEYNPGLHEILLHEKLAGRLRRVPLLRALDDNEVRWLAQVIEENTFAESSLVPVQHMPGIWIIDWGQVEVTGSASLGRPGWRLTAGNFFVAAGQSLRFGDNCRADSARAHLKSHLFYLPAGHADRLIAGIPDVGTIVHQPIDIAAMLAGVNLDLFQDLTDAHRQHLAQFCAWEFVPAGQNITTQGAVGHSFVILRGGAAVVSALDDQGRPRPRNYLRAGDWYGGTSLTEGKPRDATVRAVVAQGANGRPGLSGAELVTLDRGDLQFAFAERRDLWKPGVTLFDRFTEITAKKRAFNWLEAGESVVWRDRPHILWFLVPELGVILVTVMLWLLSITVTHAVPFMIPLVLTGLFLVPLGIWVVINYLDDYYVATNRRVARHDRRLLMLETRMDAPIEKVQDVTVKIGLSGQIFDFGDLTIRTAAKVGNVTFSHVPRPQLVREIILEEKVEALAAARGHRKELLRQGLINTLHLALSVPNLERALGANVQPPSPLERWGITSRLLRRGKSQKATLLPGTKRGPGLTRSLFRWLPDNWQIALLGPPPPTPKPLPGQVLWRKHWVNMLQRTGLPFLATLLVVMLGIWMLVSPPDFLKFGASALFLGWLVLFIPAAIWLVYQYIDYHNDIYVVTDTKIIDIEKKPLWLSAERREGGLDRVQTVYTRQDGFWANFLDYGDVIIRTAAADEGFTFEFMPNPKSVQGVVFQKLEAFQRKQEERRTQERQRELIEGLNVYHQLREERGY